MAEFTLPINLRGRELFFQGEAQPFGEVEDPLLGIYVANSPRELKGIGISPIKTVNLNSLFGNTGQTEKTQSYELEVSAEIEPTLADIFYVGIRAISGGYKVNQEMSYVRVVKPPIEFLVSAVIVSADANTDYLDPEYTLQVAVSIVPSSPTPYDNQFEIVYSFFDADDNFVGGGIGYVTAIKFADTYDFPLSLGDIGNNFPSWEYCQISLQCELNPGDQGYVFTGDAGQVTINRAIIYPAAPLGFPQVLGFSGAAGNGIMDGGYLTKRIPFPAGGVNGNKLYTMFYANRVTGSPAVQLKDWGTSVDFAGGTESIFTPVELHRFWLSTVLGTADPGMYTIPNTDASFIGGILLISAGGYEAATTQQSISQASGVSINCQPYPSPGRPNSKRLILTTLAFPTGINEPKNVVLPVNYSFGGIVVGQYLTLMFAYRYVQATGDTPGPWSFPNSCPARTTTYGVHL